MEYRIVSGMKTHIYALSDPETGEVFYVGKTHISLADRLSCFIRDTARKDKQKWVEDLAKRGLKPAIESIETFDAKVDDWEERERFWIAYFRFLGFRLCNLSRGGKSGTLGVKHAEEWKANARQRKHTEEFKEHLRKLNTGKKMSPAAIDKLRTRTFTPIHRQRLSESQRGNKKGIGHVVTEAHKEILRARFAGKPLSEEHREKLKAAWVLRRARGK